MLETGHPLHAFDLDRLRGGIVQVRRANRGEQMKTLDGIERPLQESDVVIADGQGAVALAGVMGGAEQRGLGDDDRGPAGGGDLRSARRAPDGQAARACTARRRTGSSAASTPKGCRTPAARAAAMLARLGGGALAGEGIDRYPQQQHPRRVTLSLAGLTRLAGFEIPLAQAAEKLAAIGIASAPDGADTIAATVPTFRPDMTIEEDLVEEVMRLVGYDRAPARLPRGSGAPAPSPEALADRARDALAALGLHEIVSWGFVPRPGWRRWAAALADGIALKNPISADYEVMRTSLLPGLVDAARRNLARSVTDVGLFEVGPIVRRAADPKEAPVETAGGRGAFWSGAAPAGSSPSEPVDFFDAKRDRPRAPARAGGRGAGVRAAGAPTAPALFHPGVSAEIRTSGADGHPIGQVGEIHPRLRRKLGLDASRVLSRGRARRDRRRAAPGPQRGPAALPGLVARSLVLDRRRRHRRRAAGAAGLGRRAAACAIWPSSRTTETRATRLAGKKGMLWTLIYRADDRTLTDVEVDAAHARIVSTLKDSPSVVLRQ